jgi:hypothetical protein
MPQTSGHGSIALYNHTSVIGFNRNAGIFISLIGLRVFGKKLDLDEKNCWGVEGIGLVAGIGFEPMTFGL